jgi:sugar phosphate permease
MRPRFYYGWVIVAVVALVGVAENAEFHPTIGAFIKPMTGEFNWTRSQFVGAISMGTILGGLTATFVGPLLDRYGPRWLLFGSFVVIGALLATMSLVNHLWQFYILMGMGRLLTQGVGSVASNVVVAKWFVRKRGRAVGLSHFGSRLGNGLVPLYVQAFITLRGWRSATVALGILTWALTLIPTSVFLRRQPEDLGLRPDGDPPEAVPSQEDEARVQASPTPEREFSFTLREALHTRAFYLLLAATSGAFFSGAGFNLHALAYFSDRGFSPGIAVTLVATWSLLASGVTLLSGFLAERVSVRHVMIGVYGAWAMSMVYVSQVTTVPMAFGFAIMFGVVFGVLPIVNMMIFANYFGREYLGAIRGFITPFQMGFNAMGPLVGALVFDFTGEYSLVLALFVLMLSISTTMAVLATAPPLPRRAAQSVP